MNDITIKIEFFSPWSCSSGLSAGAEADGLVIKDTNGIPYIPGKTVKGVIREAVEDYISFSGLSVSLDNSFGKNAEECGDDLPQKGSLFFSNAHLAEDEAEAIVAEGMTEFLYTNRTSTAIDGKTGIAKDHSLRTVETTVPCTLYAQVLHVDNELLRIMEQALGLIKHMGIGRNRGMGRCRFSIEKGGKR